jgi:hypothetical protein
MTPTSVAVVRGLGARLRRTFGNADCYYCHPSYVGYRADRRGAVAKIRGRRSHQLDERILVEPRHGQRLVAHDRFACGRIFRHQPRLVVAGKLSAPPDFDHQYRRIPGTRSAGRAGAFGPPRPRQWRRAQSIAEGHTGLAGATRPVSDAGPSSERATGAAIEVAKHEHASRIGPNDQASSAHNFVIAAKPQRSRIIYCNR